MTQILLCGLYTALFIFIIYKFAFFRLPGISRTNTLLLFFLKIVCTTIVWKLFLKFYPVTDSSKFLFESQILYNAFFEHTSAFFKLLFGLGDDPEMQAIRAKMIVWNKTEGSFLIVDTRTMIRLYAVLRFFSFGYFYVQAVIMCFLSFIGLVYFYKTFFPYFRNASIVLIIACFLLPSVVFWTSTVLKEGVLFLGIGLMLYHCQCGLRRYYTLKNMLGLVLGATMLIFIKFYVFIAMLPALLANFWIANSNHKRVVLKYSVVYVFFLTFLLTARFISPSLDFARVLKKKQTDFLNVARGGMVIYHDTCLVYLDYDVREARLQLVAPNTYKLKKGYKYASFKYGKTDTVWIDASDTSKFTGYFMMVPAGSAFPIHEIKPDMIDVLKNAPWALMNGLIMPPLFEMNKAFSGFILVENLLILSCLLGSFFFLKKRIPLAVILFCASFIAILFVLIGLTTPVLGALVRYRIPGIPFLILIIGLLADEMKIKQVIFKVKQRLFKG